MKHKIRFFSNACGMLYEWLCCSLAFAFAEVVFLKQEPHFSLAGVTLVMFLYSYILREKADRYFWLFAGHVILRVPIFLIPVSSETQWFYFLIPCYLFFASLHYKRGSFKNRTDDIPWPSFLLCLTIYLVSGYLKERGLQMDAYITTLLLLFLYLVLVYLDGMQQYLDASKYVSGMPVGQILSVNTCMVGVIIACLMLGLAAGTIFDLKRLVQLFFDAILAVVRVIGMGIGAFFNFVSLWFRGGNTDVGEHREFEDSDMPASVQSVGQTLEPVLYVGLICLGVFVMYKISVRFVRFLMTRRNNSGDLVEMIAVKKEKKERKEAGSKKRLFLTKKQRARKYYKDCIERYRYDIALLPSATTGEIRTELLDKDISDVREITAYYEKLRYGGVDVDRQMLVKMRELSMHR